MNYTITKEQILKLSKINAVVKENLNELFPDAFKPELELGKWYRNTNKALANYQGGIKGYGFTIDGEWGLFKDNWSFDSPENWKPATHEEVEAALIAEAKKRGFVDGAKFKSSLSENGDVRTVRESYQCELNPLSNTLHVSTPRKEWDEFQSNPCIFKDGNWAEIIPEEKKIITKEKAEKILSKKYGKTVEIT